MFRSFDGRRRVVGMHYFVFHLLVENTLLKMDDAMAPSLHAALSWSIELNFTSLTYASATESDAPHPFSSPPCFPHLATVPTR